MAPVKPKYQTLAGRDDDNNNNNNNNAVVVNDDDSSKPAEPPIEVIILDFTHTRFSVPLAAGLASTVADLKMAGARHHSVSANQQRLIFQGKLLSDENATVQQCGIHHGSIVHLFPKPRVVVTNSSNSNSGGAPANHTNEQAAASHQENNNSSGRVPTIVLDEAEHARRGHILVLGSADYMEAVNNVKLFSFMLLIISTIELLNLVAVALGEGTVGDPSRSSSGLPTNDVIPYIEHDDFFPSEDDTATPTGDGSNNSNNGGFDNGTTNADGTNNMFNPYQTWSSLSWVDLVVSVLGIYVALLGVRASNDNVLSIARLYLVGTIITGVGWLVYNFIINFEIDEMAREQQQGGNNNNNNDPYHPSMPPPSSPLNGNGVNNSDSVFNQAVQAMILPAVVWGLCIFRAWQFQHLLAEAELEALERIQSEEEQEGEENDGNDEEQALQQQQQQPPPLPNRLASVSPPAPLPTIS
jgi:Ubiquitin family